MLPVRSCKGLLDVALRGVLVGDEAGMLSCDIARGSGEGDRNS